MKKLIAVIALIMSVATLAKANNVTDTGPATQPGSILYFNGTTGNDQGVWAPIQSVINTYVTNTQTVGVSLNGGAVSSVGNLDITGTGITQTVNGSGLSGTSSYDFSNLQTVQGNTNATNITNLSSSLNTTNSNVTNLTNTVNSNSTDISGLQSTVANHTTQINQNTSDISTLNTNLTTESNTRQSQVDAINNMSDPSTVLNQTVNGNTTAIANETTRAEGVESGLQSGLDTETKARIAGDQALQNQVNNLNTQAQDNTNRIDRLEQTKYLLEPVVRLYDDKHWQVQAFDSYDVRHGLNAALGMRVMFKVGKSYEEKLLSKTNPEIARLLAFNVKNDVAERVAIRKQLAEDRNLILQQAALIKQLQSMSSNVVFQSPVSEKMSSKVISHGDVGEELLKAMDDRAESFAGR